MSLPDDFMAPKFLYLSGKTYKLDLKSYDLEALTLTWEGATATGEPRYGALEGVTLEIRPAADQAYTLKGKYLPLWTDAEATGEQTVLNGMFNRLFKRFIHMRCLTRDAGIRTKE